MASNRLKQIIATVAPGLATALGGPLAGMATKAIADKVLGKPDASLDDVERAILGGSPADLVKLKELELTFRAQMKEAGIELEKVAADDRDSARKRQVQLKDWTPSILGVVVVGGFFATLAYIIKYGMPVSGTEVLLIMVGALGAMTTQVCNFFFGSSVGSKVKDRSIGDALAKMGEKSRG